MDPRLEFSINQANSHNGYVIQHGLQDTLHHAAQFNDVETMQRILAVDPQALNRSHSIHGTTAICWSIEASSHDATVLLLNSGAELMPIFGPTEQYFPVHFLDNDTSAYTQVELEVFNRTTGILESQLSNYISLAPSELCVVMQGYIALGRKFKEDFGRYQYLMNMYNHMKQMIFDIELKHNYLLCNLLGIRSLGDVYNVPRLSTPEGDDARVATMTELKTLVGMIPPKYINPIISYALFNYACDKITSGVPDYRIVFDAALACAPATDKFYQAAIVLNLCNYLVNVDVDDEETDQTLDNITSLIFPTIVDLADMAFKNHSLAELFVILATNIVETLEDGEDFAISLFSEAIRFEMQVDDVNLYRRAILLLRADKVLLEDDKDLHDASELLEKMNDLPAPVINSPDSEFYSSYLAVITDKSTAIIKTMLSEAKDLADQGNREDIEAEMPGHFSIIEECLKLLLAHLAFDTTITMKVSKVFFDINKLMTETRWNFTESSTDFAVATHISDFMRTMADFTKYDYVRLYHADFLFAHLEYHESLENYIKLARSYLQNNYQEFFVKAVKNIVEIQYYFNDQLVVELLNQLIEFQLYAPINTSHLFFELMKQTLEMPNEKWLAELYLAFAEKIHEVICAQDVEAPLLIYGFHFPSINEKLAFIASYSLIKMDAARFLRTPVVIPQLTTSPRFFARADDSVHDEKTQVCVRMELR